MISCQCNQNCWCERVKMKDKKEIQYIMYDNWAPLKDITQHTNTFILHWQMQLPFTVNYFTSPLDALSWQEPLCCSAYSLMRYFSFNLHKFHDSTSMHTYIYDVKFSYIASQKSYIHLVYSIQVVRFLLFLQILTSPCYTNWSKTF